MEPTRRSQLDSLPYSHLPKGRLTPSSKRIHAGCEIQRQTVNRENRLTDSIGIDSHQHYQSPLHKRRAKRRRKKERNTIQHKEAHAHVTITTKSPCLPTTRLSSHDMRFRRRMVFRRQNKPNAGPYSVKQTLTDRSAAKLSQRRHTSMEHTLQDHATLRRQRKANYLLRKRKQTPEILDPR